MRLLLYYSICLYFTLSIEMIVCQCILVCMYMCITQSMACEIIFSIAYRSQAFQFIFFTSLLYIHNIHTQLDIHIYIEIYIYIYMFWCRYKDIEPYNWKTTGDNQNSQSAINQFSICFYLSLLSLEIITRRISWCDMIWW